VAIPAPIGSATPPGRGWLTTTSAALGVLVEAPIARGLSFRTGLDLQLARGTIDPAPSGGSPGMALQAIALIGIAGTLSTDPARAVRKDPLEEEQARERAEPGAWQRMDDRAREYQPRRGDGADSDVIDSDRAPPDEADRDR
jgi:hypothetical protein